MPVATPTQLVLLPGRPRMLLANNTTAASAFPSFSSISQTKPASVDDSGTPTGNYAVIHTADFPGSVVTLQFGGAGTDNETGKARILVVPKPVIAAPGGSGTEEYIAQWLADIDFTVSGNLPGTAGGVSGGTGFLYADTVTSPASDPTSALNVISPADDTNPGSVQITHNGAQYIVVLMHRNSSLDSVNGLYMLG